MYICISMIFNARHTHVKLVFHHPGVVSQIRLVLFLAIDQGSCFLGISAMFAHVFSPRHSAAHVFIHKCSLGFHFAGKQTWGTVVQLSE